MHLALLPPSHRSFSVPICVSLLHLSVSPLMCISHLHLSVAPLSFRPLDVTSHVHLSVSPLVCNSHERSHMNLSLEHFVRNCRLQFSFETLIRTSWLHSSLQPRCCTCHVHLLFATSLSFTGSFPFLSVTTLIGTSRAAFTCTSQFHLSFEPVIRTFCSHLSMAPVIPPLS